MKTAAIILIVCGTPKSAKKCNLQILEDSQNGQRSDTLQRNFPLLRPMNPTAGFAIIFMHPQRTRRNKKMKNTSCVNMGICVQCRKQCQKPQWHDLDLIMMATFLCGGFPKESKLKDIQPPSWTKSLESRVYFARKLCGSGSSEWWCDLVTHSYRVFEEKVHVSSELRKKLLILISKEAPLSWKFNTRVQLWASR